MTHETRVATLLPSGLRAEEPVRWRFLMILAALLVWGAGLAVGQDADEEPQDVPVAPEEEDGDGGAASAEEIAQEIEAWKAMFNEGDYRKAGRKIDRLVRDNPDSIEAGLALTRQTMFEGKQRKARRLLDDLADTHPEDSRVRSLRAQLLVESGEYEAAETLLREIVEADPDDLASRYRLAYLLDTELGRRREAFDIYGSFYDWYNGLSYEQAEEMTAEERYYLGMSCWGYESPHEALDEMYKATKIDSTFVDAYIGQGFLFLDKYDRPKARKEFEAALQINPHHPDALCGIAACHLAEFGQIDEAEAALKKARRVNPNHVTALILSAHARMDAQDYDSAARLVDAALESNPASLEALSLKAALAFLTHEDLEFDRIRALVAEREGPALAVLWNTTAEFLAGRHRYPEAVEFGRKAIAADSKFSRAYVNLGINMTRSGDDWEEGKKILEDAYDRDQFNIQVYNLLELLDDYEKDYDEIVTEHMVIRLTKGEKEVIGYELETLLEQAYDILTKKYHVELPRPVLIEMLPDHADFSVRSVGQTGLGALGVCFGKVVTLLSPEGMKQQTPQGEQIRRFNWGQTAWHEFTHVVTLTKTGSRIPRWFTEGLSVFEEKERRAEWARELEVPVYDALMSNSIRGIADLNEGFTRGSEIMLSYYVGSMVCEFVRDEFGFDKILEMLDLYNQDLKTERVIEKVFGFDHEQFDVKFREYLHEIFAEYQLTPRYTKQNIVQWRDELDEDPDEPTRIDLHSKLANAYWFNNAVADAEINAVRAINLFEGMEDPADETGAAAASAYIVLARIFKERDRIEKSKEFFDKAFELGSDDFFAHRTRAQIAQSENDVETAIAEYEAALEAFPRYASPPDSPYRQLYQLYLEEGEEEKAFAILESFCRINDEDLEVRKILAKHYQDTGEDDKLREILRQARLISCSDPEVNSMQSSLGADGDGDPATRVRQIKSALGVPGLSTADRVRLQTDLAEALMEMGRLMEALDTIEEALALEDYARAEKVQLEIEARIAVNPQEGRVLERRRLERKVADVELDSAERGEAYVKLARLLIEDDELFDAQDMLEEALELPVPVPGAESLLEEVKRKLAEDR